MAEGVNAIIIDKIIVRRCFMRQHSIAQARKGISEAVIGHDLRSLKDDIRVGRGSIGLMLENIGHYPSGF